MNRVFAAMYERMMASSEEAGIRAKRSEMVGMAEGEVLEIGAGTGLNLIHYDPARVSRVVVTEPSPHMLKRLRSKPARVPFEVVQASADRLPFADESFDSVLATLVLCSVPDPAAALDEIARVLRPGGRFIFAEHVRASEPGLARWQDRLERPWGWIGDGCHPNRDTLAALEASPLELEHHGEWALPKAPSIVRPAAAGVARRPGG